MKRTKWKLNEEGVRMVMTGLGPIFSTLVTLSSEQLALLFIGIRPIAQCPFLVVEMTPLLGRIVVAGVQF